MQRTTRGSLFNVHLNFGHLQRMMFFSWLEDEQLEGPFFVFGQPLVLVLLIRRRPSNLDFFGHLAVESALLPVHACRRPRVYLQSISDQTRTLATTST